ncbi:unnamed protein product [Owenia fusiformis]|uniref:Uncharacterized protein n=1 Tax=Owenia fusiformis TaxID=6347 RepID=A0A8J1TS51_OWEFU|nr:unnamed protein product [Owenia fusiformis]
MVSIDLCKYNKDVVVALYRRIMILSSEFYFVRLAVLLCMMRNVHSTIDRNGKSISEKFAKKNATCDEIPGPEDLLVSCQNMDFSNGFPKLPEDVTDLVIDTCKMPIIQNYSYGLLPRLWKLEISYSNVSLVAPDAFSMMPNLTDINLSNNTLKEIPANIFWLNRITNVDLSGNQIRNITFPSNISAREDIDISIRLSYNMIGKTTIQNGTFNALANFTSVSLFLDGNDISTLHPSTFLGINRFNILDLSNNNFGKKISLMDIGLCIRDKPTKVLKMTNCKLNRTLTEKMFKTMSNSSIESLDLSGNSWTIWPKNTLKHLKNLRNLTVNNCRYFAFFEAAKELEEVLNVSLSSNGLLKTHIISIIIASSKKIQYLNISSNHFQDHFKDIKRLNSTSLKTFDMSNNNQIVTETSQLDYYKAMRNLSILRLSNTNSDLIHNMDIGTLRLTNMSKLEFLDLSLNKIYINRTTLNASFMGLTSLKTIVLSYNNLANTPFDALEAFFHQLPTLKSIDLSFNNIQHLPYDVFSGMPNLTELILQGNRMTSFSNKYIMNNPKLQRLLLQRNALTWIDATMFAKLTSSFTLNIENNAFYCSCNLRDFRQWLNSRNKNVVIVKGENQHCKTPSRFNETSIKRFELPWLECDNHLAIMVSAWIAAPLLLASMVAVIISYYRWDIKYWWILRRSRRTRRGYTELTESRVSNGFVYDGFVSYNSESQGWVIDQLLPNMERSPDDVNVKLCFDGRDFIPGKFIADNIVDSIKESRKMMFIISKRFIESQWCAFELEMAHLRQFEEKKNLIVLIFLEKIPKKKLPKKISLLMRHVTYVEWDEDNLRSQSLMWKKLKLSLLDIPCDLTYGNIA